MRWFGSARATAKLRFPMRKTRIVCTLGPSSVEVLTLRRLFAAGMDVARLNFSHGDEATHRAAVKAVRQVTQETGRYVALLQDLQGPKIRTEALTEAMERLGWRAPVVAKLEKLQAIRNLRDIIAASDAVMVARGDLGVEMALGEVPAIQKDIINRANRAGVPVITATEMLESMVTSNRPTRAEASDVANAIWDGTDAVMLSQETSTGAHPVEAVRAMARICLAAESHPAYQRERPVWKEPSLSSAIAHASAATAA